MLIWLSTFSLTCSVQSRIFNNPRSLKIYCFKTAGADQPLASGSAPLHPAPLRSAIPVLDDEKRAGHTLDATGETGALNDRNLPQVGTLSDDSEFASAEPGSAATYLPVDSTDVASQPFELAVELGSYRSGVMTRWQVPRSVGNEDVPADHLVDPVGFTAVPVDVPANFVSPPNVEVGVDQACNTVGLKPFLSITRPTLSTLIPDDHL